MNRYVVEWRIDVEADTPEEAARIAFGHMQRPGTTANVFAVCDEYGNETQVNLEDSDDN